MRWTPPKDIELQLLRCILGTKKGATSFEDLKTVAVVNDFGVVKQVVCETFKEAAEKMGLLEDGDLFQKTMEEVIRTTISSRCVRFTLAILLANFDVPESAVREVWEKHKYNICKPPEKSRARQELMVEEVTPAEEALALLDIEKILQSNTNTREREEGQGILPLFGLPSRCAEPERH